MRMCECVSVYMCEDEHVCTSVRPNTWLSIKEHKNGNEAKLYNSKFGTWLRLGMDKNTANLTGVQVGHITVGGAQSVLLQALSEVHLASCSLKWHAGAPDLVGYEVGPKLRKSLILSIFSMWINTTTTWQTSSSLIPRVRGWLDCILAMWKVNWYQVEHAVQLVCAALLDPNISKEMITTCALIPGIWFCCKSVRPSMMYCVCWARSCVCDVLSWSRTFVKFCMVSLMLNCTSGASVCCRKAGEEVKT